MLQRLSALPCLSGNQGMIIQDAIAANASELNLSYPRELPSGRGDTYRTR